MDTNTYDDGLVHCHNWACEAQAAQTGGTKPQGAEMAAPGSAHAEEEQFFDDGLVHSHDWARS